MEKKKTEKKEMELRPPIVVVMGHIDHGKTKILDWYRKTKIVEQESGGITQHIGAFQVEIPTPPTGVGGSGPRPHASGKITFIDTPGHEAFSKMRSRGATVADIGILVVAADEGVKPQTKEAIQIIRDAKIPFVVAINKIDKPEANVDRTKQQLAEIDVLVESYGGQIPSVEISAKNGDHMDDLLEVLLLLAELENLSMHPEQPAAGVVIEAHLDSRRGITATLLVRDGSFARGDVLVIGRTVETIKILEDFRGQVIEQVGPSAPIRVTGLSQTPMVGDNFKKFNTREEADAFIKTLPEEIAIPATLISTEKPVFNIILKTDVVGSREVLEELIKKMESEIVQINILKSEVGDINESDVKMALATKLVTIVGFKVKMGSSVRELADRSNIRIVQGDIIYEVLDEVKKNIEDMMPPEIRRTELGRAKILKVFKREGSKQIIGGRVEDGLIKKGGRVDIKHMKDLVGSGTILQLQRDKIDTESVGKGSEFGIMVEAKPVIEEGDVIEIFEETVMKRKL